MLYIGILRPIVRILPEMPEPLAAPGIRVLARRARSRSNRSDMVPERLQVYKMNPKNLAQLLIGQRFGRLVVARVAERDSKRKNSRVKCVCDCGKWPVVVDAHKILDGLTKSCGCFLRRKVLSDAQLSMAAELFNDNVADTSLEWPEPFLDEVIDKDIPRTDQTIVSNKDQEAALDLARALGYVPIVPTAKAGKIHRLIG